MLWLIYLCVDEGRRFGSRNLPAICLQTACEDPLSRQSGQIAGRLQADLKPTLTCENKPNRQNRQFPTPHAYGPKARGGPKVGTGAIGRSAAETAYSAYARSRGAAA